MEVGGSVGDGGKPVWVGVDVATGVIEGSGASGEVVWLETGDEETVLQAVSKIKSQRNACFEKGICLKGNCFNSYAAISSRTF